MIIDVVVVSTSRHRKYGPVEKPEEAEDLSGRAILNRLEVEGRSFTYRLIPDGVEAVRGAILASGADVIVLCGGTGLAPKDLTIEAAEPLFDKTIPGFGEAFRLKSLEDVGTRAILTRASAGIVGDVPVFCLPGSPSAARLGIDLILAEIDHILHHISE
ncbi:MAG: MogA/MoaB family molybdenum cofactor biosynthesis protein [Methanothrix sp.]|jgi:molybdenum cofactor biosynthesis protein B|uniref:Molybdenum cofactor synthesis domain protein n=1 Tax=Methanothrix harundinacea TaxID=301375 RepID=A0A101IKJ0_9EURY|nr:MAG: Molybdenum cofactor synthesis domain protein [Methanothrix harundinacea]MDD2637404.1 MogA/MoaB family molybdenum cofactor biosynthesis protein [Methanothrix sp.]MDI9399583.1 MogA/MoaB family molybdenum cofactor biosynthesis protein [Euryarchaeota archaeon]KUK96923.1 MAG: Molybdenum cofactor synthesis domain protein [Methanothrix harundinacea]MCP1392869.1 MogA/MoaB family molybdenum cofactor biosynthesis protein [Methanothrix harundinacea]